MISILPRTTSCVRTFSSSSRRAISFPIRNWIDRNEPLDFKTIRSWINSGYELLNQSQLADSLSAKVLPEINSLLRYKVFSVEISELVSEVVDVHLRVLSTEDLVTLLSAISKLENGCSRLIDEIVSELNQEKRLSQLKTLRSWRIWLQCLHAHAHVNLSSRETIRVCMDNLAWSVASMSAQDIDLLLSCMCKMRATHQQLQGNVIYILPVIPCTDTELDSIVGSLVSLGAGTDEDRRFLLDLVRFRTASVVE